MAQRDARAAVAAGPVVLPETSERGPARWYRHWWLVLGALLLLPPVGLLLVWLQRWKVATKVVATVSVIGAVVVLAVVPAVWRIPGSGGLPWARAHTSVYLERWGPRRLDLQRELEAMNTAATDVSVAIGLKDSAAARTSCQDLLDASARMKATLPTPDPELTGLFVEAGDRFTEAARACLDADPEDMTVVATIIDRMVEGTGAIKRATTRLNDLKAAAG